LHSTLLYLMLMLILLILLVLLILLLLLLLRRLILIWVVILWLARESRRVRSSVSCASATVRCSVIVRSAGVR